MRSAQLAPDGVDVVVEVAPAANAALDTAVLAADGTVAAYATDGGGQARLAVGDLMWRNIRYQFVLVYTVPAAVKDAAVADVLGGSRRRGAAGREPRPACRCTASRSSGPPPPTPRSRPAPSARC